MDAYGVILTPDFRSLQTIWILLMLQTFLEDSNVEPVLEMVKMIDTFRSYEAEQRAIQIQDSTLERAVNDLGRVS